MRSLWMVFHRACGKLVDKCNPIVEFTKFSGFLIKRSFFSRKKYLYFSMSYELFGFLG